MKKRWKEGVMLLIASGFSLGAVRTLMADEVDAICCEYSVPDCEKTEYPQCYIIGADCNPIEDGNQGYCMKPPGI